MLQTPIHTHTSHAVLIAGLLATLLCAGQPSQSTGASNLPHDRQGETKDLNPFTHVAYLPPGADLGSIRFEGARMVQVPVKIRQTASPHCQDTGFSEPGGHAPCSHTQTVSREQAWEVTYSYDGQPMTSDEYGGRHYTVHVYFRADELAPDAQKALSAKRQSRVEKAAYFATKTYRDPARKTTFCDGRFQDGAWIQTDPNCRDKVSYKTTIGDSGYVALRVDPVPPNARNARTTPANLTRQLAGRSF
jgi:hypothetical protein